MPDVYMVSDTAFQVDCADGASYVFAPSRFAVGNAEVLERWQPDGCVSAREALVAAVVACL